jgi:hypothetical protein
MRSQFKANLLTVFDMLRHGMFSESQLEDLFPQPAAAAKANRDDTRGTAGSTQLEVEMPKDRQIGYFP